MSYSHITASFEGANEDSIIGLVTPDMLSSITWGTYLFFAVFCLIAFAFTLFVIPETRGKVCTLCYSIMSLTNRYVS